MPNETERAIAEHIATSYSILDLMRALQLEKGRFTMQEFAELLAREYRIDGVQARDIAPRMVARWAWMIQVRDGGMQLVEPAPPTIAQTISGLKKMANRRRPPRRELDE